MGKVFTWEEVSRGHIPYLESFDEMGKLLKRELEASSVVVSALLIGSFLRRDHSVRSDIDTLVVYPLERRPEAMALLRGLKARAKQLYVPIEFISLDVELAMTPDHHIASTFLEHFRMAARDGGVVKQDPLSLIHSNRDGFREDTRAYLIHKMRTFEKGEVSLLTSSEERIFQTIEKALQLPVYVARKMLRCFDVEMSYGDSKAEVARLYPALGIEGTTDILAEIREMDRSYTASLTQQLTCPDPEEYGRVIESLKSAIPLALEFSRKNLFALR